MADPPDHTRLRGLVSQAFTPRMIEQLRPRIQQITDELLDAVQHEGKMDLISDFAYPLPITVISEMLGIPVADRQQFRSWTQTLVNVGEKFDQDIAAQTRHPLLSGSVTCSPGRSDRHWYTAATHAQPAPGNRF